MDLAGLEEAQQLDLLVEAHLTDLVEEERSALVGADDSGKVVDGAGECAAAVPEEVALEHVAGNGGTDEHGEWLLRARRRFVHFACDDLFAGASLTSDQNGEKRGSNPSGEFRQLAHLRRHKHIALKHQALLNRPK